MGMFVLFFFGESYGIDLRVIWLRGNGFNVMEEVVFLVYYVDFEIIFL